MSTIGLIGAGHIGSQIARLATANGYNVVISNSRGPETLSSLVKELGPKARAATAADAAKAGDIVVVTVPLKNYRSVPVEPLAGKIVIDTNNYYPQRDGHIRELDDESTTTSELLQAHLPTSKVVKAFNHIYAAELTTHGQPAGSKNRRALVIAGDDAAAKAVVTKLLDEFGFDTVDAGPLKEGWRIQRATPGYGPRRTAEEYAKGRISLDQARQQILDLAGGINRVQWQSDSGLHESTRDSSYEGKLSQDRVRARGASKPAVSGGAGNDTGRGARHLESRASQEPHHSVQQSLQCIVAIGALSV